MEDAMENARDAGALLAAGLGVAALAVLSTRGNPLMLLDVGRAMVNFTTNMLTILVAECEEALEVEHARLDDAARA